MPTMDEINRQHMEAMGVDPEQLGKESPKAEKYTGPRCKAVNAAYNVQCVRFEGHDGVHVRGSVKWHPGEYEVAEEQPDDLHVKARLDALLVKCEGLDDDAPVSIGWMYEDDHSNIATGDLTVGDLRVIAKALDQ